MLVGKGKESNSDYPNNGERSDTFWSNPEKTLCVVLPWKRDYSCRRTSCPQLRWVRNRSRNTPRVLLSTERCQQEALLLIAAGMPNDKGLESLEHIRFLSQIKQTIRQKSFFHPWVRCGFVFAWGVELLGFAAWIARCVSCKTKYWRKTDSGQSRAIERCKVLCKES